MFSVLVLRELEELYVAAKISERVIRLGISETEFKIWNAW